MHVSSVSIEVRDFYPSRSLCLVYSILISFLGYRRVRRAATMESTTTSQTNGIVTLFSLAYGLYSRLLTYLSATDTVSARTHELLQPLRRRCFRNTSAFLQCTPSYLCVCCLPSESTPCTNVHILRVHRLGGDSHWYQQYFLVAIRTRRTQHTAPNGLHLLWRLELVIFCSIRH